MKDGNKESTKELLATFRVIIGADVSIFLLFANLQLRDLLTISQPGVFTAGLVAAALSASLCAWLFLIAVRMLHDEDDDIVYQAPVLTLGGGAIAALVAAIAMLLIAQM